MMNTTFPKKTASKKKKFNLTFYYMKDKFFDLGIYQNEDEGLLVKYKYWNEDKETWARAKTVKTELELIGAIVPFMGNDSFQYVKNLFNDLADDLKIVDSNVNVKRINKIISLLEQGKNVKLEQYINSDSEERLIFFMSTLSATNRTPEYYVNWDKVECETKKYELELNTLNFLIGKPDIRERALELFQTQPELIKALPSLIASRDKVIDVLELDKEDTMSFYQLNFEVIDKTKISNYVDFCEKAGLLDFLQNKANRSLVDYVYGIEAGLDSNARKNRSGTTMEGILERSVTKACGELDLEYKAQATASFIRNNWGLEVPVDKSERRFDEAIFDPATKRLWLIETNYYGGGGSKLKAVAGEFTELNQFISSAKADVSFVWITDGQGWKTAHLPLAAAFGHIVNVFNLEMLRQGYLSDLFS